MDIIISVLDIITLALLLWIIQFYIQPRDTSTPSFLPGWMANRDSIGFIAFYFVVFAAKNIAAYLVTQARYGFISRVALRISKNNLTRYQQAGFGEFVNVDSSAHIRKIAFLPLEFCQHILSGIPEIITQLVLILAAIAAIILFNAKLFLLLLLILLPPVIAIFYFIRSRLGKVRKQITKGNEISFRHLMDALKGYVESNIYGRNSFFLNRFSNSREKFTAALFESTSIQTMPSRIIEIFAVLGLFILIAIAKWSGNNDTNYLITIGAFVGAAYKIIPGIVKIINLSGQIRAYTISMDDLAKDVTPDDHPVNLTLSNGLNSIEMKDASYRYGQTIVVDNFSFRIEKGELIGLSGESGRGKTTVLNLLLGFLGAEKGTIAINDHVADKAELQSAWAHIAYVKQQPFFIHDTILHNITLENDGYDKVKLEFALESSGLNKLIDDAGGLEKFITENGKNISGGQRQRIAVARAFYKDADFLILDEPFSELDEEAECLLMEKLKQLTHAGKMVLLITHNPKSLSMCDQVVSL